MFASQRPLLRLPWIVLALFLSSAAGDPKPDCQRSCGNFSIDYPFGIGEGCFMPGFEVTCNASYSPPKPLLRLGLIFMSGTGYGTPVSSVASIILTNTPFVLNNTANKFTVIGCNSLGLLYLQDVNITTGCFSCATTSVGCYQWVLLGLGCCQDSIPEGTKTIHVEIIENLLNDSKINDLYSFSASHDNCGYAFVVDQELQVRGIGSQWLFLVKDREFLIGS
ncbi:wall-associated receptor kinase 2-like [Hibiscus syriacus]|uniref:wall-associated receptor kinase 2-like n=1 Tax=Hibiscus syriacus TaxID=106335 RepID=UPI00192220E3|nr:wall-associated receptor kinase 2-like [Hibiscus syriacus]